MEPATWKTYWKDHLPDHEADACHSGSSDSTLEPGMIFMTPLVIMSGSTGGTHCLCFAEISRLSSKLKPCVCLLSAGTASRPSVLSDLPEAHFKWCCKRCRKIKTRKRRIHIWGIIYCEKDRTFNLQTKETTYQMQVDQYGISSSSLIMVKRQKAAWIIF